MLTCLSKASRTMFPFILLLFTISITTMVINPTAATDEYRKVGLDTHNKYRSDHEVPPLTLSESLNKVADKCAEYYADIQKIDHSCPYKNKMGENLYYSSGLADSDKTAAEMATTWWYNEISDYRYASPKSSDFKKTGHFTQVVWKGSKELGFAIKYTKERNEFMVTALYTPQGNIQDNKDWKDYPENVPMPVLGSHGAGLVKSGASELMGAGRTMVVKIIMIWFVRVLFSP